MLMKLIIPLGNNCWKRKWKLIMWRERLILQDWVVGMQKVKVLNKQGHLRHNTIQSRTKVVECETFISL